MSVLKVILEIKEDWKNTGGVIDAARLSRELRGGFDNAVARQKKTKTSPDA